MNITSWYKRNRKHMFIVVIIFLLLIVNILWYYFKRSIPMTLVVGDIGAIFSSLKFMIDRANYHKDLFEKRFEIYSIMNEVFWYWASYHKITEDHYIRISNDFMGRAYYLFDKKTYKFIKTLRGYLIASYKQNDQSRSERKWYFSFFAQDSWLLHKGARVAEIGYKTVTAASVVATVVVGAIAIKNQMG